MKSCSPSADPSGLGPRELEIHLMVPEVLEGPDATQGHTAWSDPAACPPASCRDPFAGPLFTLSSEHY